MPVREQRVCRPEVTAARFSRGHLLLGSLVLTIVKGPTLGGKGCDP